LALRVYGDLNTILSHCQNPCASQTGSAQRLVQHRVAVLTEGGSGGRLGFNFFGTPYNYKTKQTDSKFNQ
jgi:hypothetical protein